MYTDEKGLRFDEMIEVEKCKSFKLNECAMYQISELVRMLSCMNTGVMD